MPGTFILVYKFGRYYLTSDLHSEGGERKHIVILLWKFRKLQK